MKRDFGGVIWTNHALERLRERGISQGDAWTTFNRPEQSRYAKSKGAWIYYKTYGDQRIEVVAKQNEKKEWIILTVWSRSTRLRRGGDGERQAEKESSDSLIMKLFKKIFNVK